MSLHPYLSILVTGGEDGVVCLWDLETNKLFYMRNMGAPVTAI